MKFNKVSFGLFLLMQLISMTGFASDGIEMSDIMRSEGKIYVVVAVMAIVFGGLAVYLFMMDNRIRRMEKKVEGKK